MADDPPTERRYDKHGRDITDRIAAMKAKNPKPASPFPAGGKGWGGPAKGLPPQGPKTDFTGDETKDLPRDPVTGRVLPTPRSMEKQAVEDEICEFYAEVKRNTSESTLNRLAAADKWGDRKIGKPLQTVAGKDGAPLFPSLKVTFGTDGN